MVGVMQCLLWQGNGSAHWLVSSQFESCQSSSSTRNTCREPCREADSNTVCVCESLGISKRSFRSFRSFFEVVSWWSFRRLSEQGLGAPVN